MEEPLATLALVRRSLLANSPAVREAAAYQLRTRPLYAYAPLLISSIAAPVELSYYVSTLKDGVLGHYELFREGAEADYLATFSTGYSASSTSVVLDRRTGFPKTGFVVGPKLEERIRGANAILANLSRLSILVQDANLNAVEWNQRIFKSLTIATEVEQEPTPRAWWDWWNEYNELTKYPAAPLKAKEYSDFWCGHRSITTFSCFMAGTIVWTETGPAAIETVQIGDRVLSQDLETGELAYKLVLNTTFRPPSEIRRVRAGGSEVHATLGHPFWVLGEGWRMTKELAPGDRLHSVQGGITVEAIEQGPVAPAHNLVVEGFNTYFVGHAQLLVHDNNLRVPSKALVPGLHGEVLR